jgi:hypothetical protein
LPSIEGDFASWTFVLETPQFGRFAEESGCIAEGAKRQNDLLGIPGTTIWSTLAMMAADEEKQRLAAVHQTTQRIGQLLAGRVWKGWG